MKTIMQSASYNVQPLSEDELRDIIGGFTWLPFVGLSGSVLRDLVNDWGNFKNGLAGNPERAR